MGLSRWLFTSFAASFAATHFFPEIFRSKIITTLGFTTLSILACSVYTVVIYPHYVSPMRKVPTVPGGHWLFGQLTALVRGIFGEPEYNWARTVPTTTGLIRYIGSFGTERLIVISPSLAQELTVTKALDFQKPSWLRNGARNTIGIDNVFFAEGDLHKHYRKLFQPAFGFRHVKDLVPLFWREARVLNDGIIGEVREKERAGEEPIVNLMEWVSRATLDVIGMAGFDHDFGALRNEYNEQVVAYKKAFDTPFDDGIKTAMFMAQFLPSITPYFLSLTKHFVPLLKEKQEARIYLANLSKEILKEKQKDFEARTTPKKDILNVVLGYGEAHQEDMKDQVLMFLAAGHETSTSAICWAIYYLVKFPGQQATLRKEIYNLVPDPSVGIDGDTAAKLSKVRNFVHEVLRVRPPLNLLMREAAKDTILGDTFVPAGTEVLVSMSDFNTREEYWGPTAAEFDPDRWEGVDLHTGAVAKNYGFMTFNQGPRNCVGKEFAFNEVVVTLAGLIGQFEFGYVEGEHMHKVQDGVTGKPFGGIKTTVKVLDW